MTKIAPQGRFRQFANGGAPLAGGKLYTYTAGTTTPKTSYRDNTLNSANTNPVILDANGYADVWLDTGAYKFILRDASDNLLWTVDNIDGGGATGYASAVITKSSGFSLGINEQNNVIVCTQSLTAGLLPAATAGDGFSAILINLSTGNVTIDPNGSELINNAASLVLPAGTSTSIHTDGTNWYATAAYVPDGSVSLAKLAFSLTGIVVPFAGSIAPTGWLLCAGQSLLRTDQPALFTVLGTTYGAADGTHFNLPDLRGRSVFGLDNMGGSAANRVTVGISGIAGTTLGAVGGSESMQSHTHTATVTDPGHAHNMQGAAGLGGGATLGQTMNTPGSGPTQSSTTGITVANASTGAGSSQNMTPAMMLNYIIKT